MSGYIGTQPVPQATQTRDSFTCTAGQTSFATSGYTPGYLDVYLNGIKLAAADYTASNGSDVVLASGAALDDILEVVAYTSFEAANVTGATDFTVTGSFTSRGIDDNATSTAMTLDTLGHLLVGQSSTNTPGVGNTTNGHSLRSDGLFFSSAFQGRTGTFGRNGNDGPVLGIYKDGANAGDFGAKLASGQSRLYLGNSNTKLLFDNGADRIYPVNNDGNARNAAIDLGLNGAAFKDLYLTGGIQFDSRSNKLDDYEEGTWNPNPRGATTAGTYSLQYRLGNYVKVGNMVQCDCTLFVTGFTGTGDFEVSGLPFTNSSTAPGGLVLVQWNECPFATYSSSDQHVVGLIPANQDYIHFRASDHNQGGQLTQLQCGNSNITYLRLSMTYKTN